MQYYHTHWMFSQSIIYMRTSKLNVPSWCNLVGGGFFLWHFFDIHFVPLGGKSWNPTAEVPCRGSSLLAMQAQKPNQPKHRKRPHQILQTCVHDKRHAISHFWIKNKSFVLIISLKYMIKREKKLLLLCQSECKICQQVYLFLQGKTLHNNCTENRFNWHWQAKSKNQTCLQT